MIHRKYRPSPGTHSQQLIHVGAVDTTYTDQESEQCAQGPDGTGVTETIGDGQEVLGWSGPAVTQGKLPVGGDVEVRV